MSSFGSQIRKRLEQLRRAGQNVPRIMAEVAEGATIEAVRVAAENTPPNGGCCIFIYSYLFQINFKITIII